MHRLILLFIAVGFAGLSHAQDLRPNQAPVRPGLQAQPRITDVELRNMQTRSLSLADKLTFASAALKTNLNAADLKPSFTLNVQEAEFKKPGKASLTMKTKEGGGMSIFQMKGSVPHVGITGASDVWFDIRNSDYDRWLVTVTLRGDGANPLSFRYFSAGQHRTDTLPTNDIQTYNFVVEAGIGPKRLSIINDTPGTYYLRTFEVTPID